MAPLGAARALITGGIADLGKLELIQTQSISSNQSSVEFTSIDQGTYSTHLLTISRMKCDADNKAVELELSNDGGSSYEATAYYTSFDYMKANGTFQHKGAANSGDFTIMQNLGNSTSECFSAFVDLYNLGNAAKYSTINFQGTGFTQDPDYISVFGAGKYLVAETINALQLKFSSDNVASGVFSLYGLAE